MSDDIIVQDVSVKNEDAAVQILVTYTRRDQLAVAQVKILF